MMNFGLTVVVVGALFSSSHSFAIVVKKYQWSIQFKEDPWSVPEVHKNCPSAFTNQEIKVFLHMIKHIFPDGSLKFKSKCFIWKTCLIREVEFN